MDENIVFHLLVLSILNIYILLTSCGSKLTHRDFSLTLVRDPIQEGGGCLDHRPPQGADQLLSARVILRLASLLLLGLFGRSKVERASVLLAVKKTSVEYIVTTGNHRTDNLPLLAVNYFVNLLCRY
jgi:hypothetical protein